MTAGMSPERRRAMIEEAPLKRSGRPDEIASVALFLAEDENSFITGQVLLVDGGRMTGFAPA